MGVAPSRAISVFAFTVTVLGVAWVCAREGAVTRTPARFTDARMQLDLFMVAFSRRHVGGPNSKGTP
jgi:hypothetical protein